jgi:hypothetical protein
LEDLKDIIKRVNEKRASTNDLEIALKQIYDVKRKEILQTPTDFSHSFKTLSKYFDRFDVSFIVETEKEIIKEKIKSQFSPESDSEHSAAIKSMLSLDYEPPDHPLIIGSHLWTLWVEYTCRFLLINPNLPYDMYLDIACCRLRLKAQSLCSRISKELKEKDRLKKSTNAKTKNKLVRKQAVLETYHALDSGNRRNWSKNRIATTIEKRLTDNDGKKLVSVSTIKRYLEEEENIGC